MTKRVQDEKPERGSDVQAWIDENAAEQDIRHQGIADEMDALGPQREKWYSEFLQIIQTTGVNVSGDMKRIVGADEIPTKPDRPSKVTY